MGIDMNVCGLACYMYELKSNEEIIGPSFHPNACVCLRKCSYF